MTFLERGRCGDEWHPPRLSGSECTIGRVQPFPIISRPVLWKTIYSSLPTSMLRTVESSAVAERRGGIQQLVSHVEFRVKNTHLSTNEVLDLQRPIPVWPLAKPVFSPYAATHGEYSHIRISGTKLLAHQVAYKSYYGVKPPESFSGKSWRL